MIRRWVILALLLLAAFLLVGRFAATLYVENSWYASLGARQLWRMMFENQLIIVAGSALAAFIFLFANLYAVRRSVDSYVLLRRLGNIQIGEKVPGRYLTQLAVGVSAIIALLLSMPATRWVELAAVRMAVPFRERDPFLTRDLGFFVNWFPFEKSLFAWGMMVVAVSMLMVFVLYMLTPSLSWKRGGRLVATRYVRRHAAVLATCAMLLLAWSFRIENFQSLLEGSGLNGMFSETDRAMLSARTLLALTSALAAFFLLWAMWTDQLRLALFSVTAVLLTALGVSSLAPLVMRNVSLDRDRLGINRQFEVHRAGRSRRAYAAQDVDVLPAQPLAAYGFRDWSDAASGTAVWEPLPLSEAVAVDGAPSVVSGAPLYRQSPDGQIAEFIISDSSPSAGERTTRWTRSRYFTSNSTADAYPAQATLASDPENLVPVRVTVGGAAMVVIADSAGSVLAPSMQGKLSRLAHAWSRQDFRMLFREMPQPNPRVIMHADVRQRVARLMPFLRQDSRVFPIVVRDTAHWLVHLYSASSSYPLSQPVTVEGDQLRFMRHAGFALINSATGAVLIHPTHEPDPLLQGLLAALPDMFADPLQLPNEIGSIIPPPFDGHLVQGQIYAQYGGQPDLPVNGSVASTPRADSGTYQTGNAVLHLPVLAPSPVATSVILDRNGRMEKLLLSVGGAIPQSYQVGLAPSEVAWSEIVRRFESIRDSIDQAAPERITGGEIRGLLVNGSLALVRTLYGAQSVSGATSVRGVTVMYGDSLFFGPSLPSAVGEGEPGAAAISVSTEGFRRRVSSLYEEMRAALRRGDLAAFAKHFEALGAIVAGSGR